MVRQIENLNDLDRQLSAAMADSSFELDVVIRYLSALISLSVPIDLYTKMLNKKDRYSEAGRQDSVAADYDRLAELVLSKLPSHH